MQANRLGVKNLSLNGRVYTFQTRQDLTSYATIYRVSDGDMVTEHILDNLAVDRNYEQDIQEYLIKKHTELVRDSDSYSHTGPTNQELRNNPALALAWQEFQSVWRLCGKQ